MHNVLFLLSEVCNVIVLFNETIIYYVMHAFDWRTC